MEDRETRAPTTEPIARQASSSATPQAPTWDSPPSTEQPGKPSAEASVTTDLAARAFPDTGSPVIRTSKDVLGDPHIERRDTNESWTSEFSAHRSNTGWSIATTALTDMTDPSSPDVSSFFENVPEFEDASSPRRSSVACRPIPLPKRLPFRVPSMPSSDPDNKPRSPRYGSSPDNNSPLLRHRRIEEMSSRRPSPGRQPSQNPLSMGPGPSSPTEPSPSIAAAAQSWGKADDDTEHLEGHGQRLPSVSSASSASSATETGETGGIRDETESPKPEDNTPTPQATEGSSDDEASAELHDSICSNSSPLGDDDAGSALVPDDDMIHEVCDQVLKHSFGIQLQDLAFSDAIAAAYESARYFLDELSHIVASSSRNHVQYDSARGPGGGANSSNIPIRPAAGRGQGGRSNSNGGGAQKRPNGGQDDAGEGSGGAGDDSPGGGKRQKVSTALPPPQGPVLRLSCPFRKRNPVRFNVRDHQSCALVRFPDIPQLKRHVKNLHKQKTVSLFACPRCKQDMRTKEAYVDHLAVANERICDFQEVPSSTDPEDGITAQTEDALNDRKADRKIDEWNNLWRLLFPMDKVVPCPDFAPLIELDEVYAEFDRQNSLNGLRERIEPWLSTAEGGLDILKVDNMLDVFKQHVDGVFDTCRSQTAGVASYPGRTRNQLPRQMSSPESLKPELPVREGRGLGKRSISAPEAPQGSTDTFLNHLAQVNMVMPPQDVAVTEGAGYGVPTTSTYAGAVHGFMADVAVSGDVSQNNQPVTIPPTTHFPQEFATSQGQNAVDPLFAAHLLMRQAQHQQRQRQEQQQHRLLSSDSGIGLNTAFADQRGAINFSHVAPFGPQNGYMNHAPSMSFRPVQYVNGHTQTFTPATPLVSPISPVQEAGPFYPGSPPVGALPPEFHPSRRNSGWLGM